MQEEEGGIEAETDSDGGSKPELYSTPLSKMLRTPGAKRGRPSNVERLIRSGLLHGGSLPDMWKRGREYEDEGEELAVGASPFKKSDFTKRSPVQTVAGKEESNDTEKQLGEEATTESEANSEFAKIAHLLKEIMEKMEMERNTALEEREKIKQELKELREESAIDREVMQKEVRKIREDAEKQGIVWKRENEELKARVKTLEQQRERKEARPAESYENGRNSNQVSNTNVRKEVGREIYRLREIEEKRYRRNNIIIKGLPYDSIKKEDDVSNWIEANIGVKVKIAGEWKLGDREREVIGAEVENWQQKREIMKNKHKLAGKRIFIEDDLTKSELHIQRTLLQLAKEEREKGRAAKVAYKRIQINGIWKTWNELEEEVAAEGRSTSGTFRTETTQRRGPDERPGTQE